MHETRLKRQKRLSKSINVTCSSSGSVHKWSFNEGKGIQKKATERERESKMSYVQKPGNVVRQKTRIKHWTLTVFHYVNVSPVFPNLSFLWILAPPTVVRRMMEVKLPNEKSLNSISLKRITQRKNLLVTRVFPCLIRNKSATYFGMTEF